MNTKVFGHSIFRKKKQQINVFHLQHAHLTIKMLNFRIIITLLFLHFFV